jgi:hypothetical protein
MFSYNRDEENLKEMEKILLRHIRNKADGEGKRLWEEICI